MRSAWKLRHESYFRGASLVPLAVVANSRDWHR